MSFSIAITPLRMCKVMVGLLLVVKIYKLQGTRAYISFGLVVFSELSALQGYGRSEMVRNGQSGFILFPAGDRNYFLHPILRPTIKYKKQSEHCDFISNTNTSPYHPSPSKMLANKRFSSRPTASTAKENLKKRVQHTKN